MPFGQTRRQAAKLRYLFKETIMSTQNLTLLTDLYELTMMQGYFETQENETVVFDVFFRDNPNKSGY